jgi:hypothetical protein
MSTQASTAGYAVDYAVFCANERAGKGVDVEQIISDGRTVTFTNKGCTACSLPMFGFVNPSQGKTTNRRAGCGKTARPVRREGGSKPIDPSYPYQDSFCTYGLYPPKLAENK